MEAKAIVTGPYMLNYSTGKLEKVEEGPKLVRGQKVYASGPGAWEQIFVVVNPSTFELVEVGRPEDVGKFDLDGYFSPLSRYDKYIRPISKKFGIGKYYAEDEPLYSEEIIKASLQRAQKIEEMKRAREQKRQEDSKNNRAQLMKKYNFLSVVENKYDYKAAVTNLRTLLKREFPGVKFSVKRRYKGSDSIDITYTDGPTAKAVENVARQFQGVTFNGYEDCTETLSTDFNTLFGALDYIFANREYSEDVRNTVRAEVVADYPILSDEKVNIFHDKFFNKYGLKNSKDTGIIWYNLSSVVRARLMDTDLTVKAEKVEVRERQSKNNLTPYREKACK